MQLPAFLRDARTFASLRAHRNYRLFAVGQGISFLGTWLQNAALAWLLLQITHSPAALGFLGVWTYGPTVIFGMFGGVVSDRFDQRRTIILTQSVYLALAAALAALAWIAPLAAWQLYLFAFLGGVVQVIDSPARLSFVAQMVGKDDLPNAVALNSALINATRIIGPAIAGILIAVAGAQWCFTLNALSFVAVIVALVAMRPAELFVVPRSSEKRASVLRDVAEGFRYAWRTPPVRMVLLLLLIIATLCINFPILEPALAAQTLHAGAAVYGLITACVGLGAFIGALLTATIARANWPLLLASAGGFGAALLLLAPLRSLPAILITLVAIGIAYTFYMSTSNSLVQLATPGHLQGRVMGLYSYIFLGTAVPGALLAGWLSQIGGTTLAFFVAGGGAMVMTLVGLAWYVGYRPTPQPPVATREPCPPQQS